MGLLVDGEQGRRLGLLLEQYASASGLRVRVKGCLPGGSAAENGKIQVGDVLIRVDEASICEMGIDDVTRLIALGDCSTSTKAPKAPAPAKQISSKPCGIGLTVLDHPPHLVTDISRDGPLAGTHAVLKGDQLVAIGEEFVADASMEEVVKHVIGPEGSEVTVWLERAARAGAQSFGHHEKEKADEVRLQLRNLKNLFRDGLLDSRTYRAGVEECWKGCYSVTVRRGLKYSGGMDVSGLQRPGSWDASTVRLTFFREAANREFEVLLPRPPPAPTHGPSAAQAASESADAAAFSAGVLGSKAPYMFQEILTARSSATPPHKAPAVGGGVLAGSGQQPQESPRRSSDASPPAPNKSGGLERMLLDIRETQNKIARDQREHQERIRETRERRHRAEMQMQKHYTSPLHRPPQPSLQQQKRPLSPIQQVSHRSGDIHNSPRQHILPASPPQRSISSSSQLSSPPQPQHGRSAQHQTSPHPHPSSPSHPQMLSNPSSAVEQDRQASPQHLQRANRSPKQAGGQQQDAPAKPTPAIESRPQHLHSSGRHGGKPSPPQHPKDDRFDPNAVHAVVAFVGTGDKLGLGLLQKGEAKIAVSGLTDDGTAQKSDKICVGDELLQIDELVTSGLDVAQACALIADGDGAHVTLTLGRPRKPGGKGYAGVFKVVLPRPGRGETSPGVCKCVVCSSYSLGVPALPPMEESAPLPDSRASPGAVRSPPGCGEESIHAGGRLHGGHDGHRSEHMDAHSPVERRAYASSYESSYQRSVGHGHADEHAGDVFGNFMRKTQSVFHGLTTPRVAAERPMDGLLRLTAGILMASDDTDSRHIDVHSDGRWREEDQDQRTAGHTYY